MGRTGTKDTEVAQIFEPLHTCQHRHPRYQPSSATQKLFQEQTARLDRATRQGLTLDGIPLRAAMTAKVLGRLQRGDGADLEEVSRRLGMAATKMKTFLWLWHSKAITGEDKMIVYRAVIVATISYGCEAWYLTEDIRKLLRRFNKRWFVDIIASPQFTPNPPTGNQPTFRFNLEGHIQLTRLHWIGHVWRMELTSATPRLPFRIMLTTIKYLTQPRIVRHTAPPYNTDYDFSNDPYTIDFALDTEATFAEGSLYELVPPTATFQALVTMFLGARDARHIEDVSAIRTAWLARAKAIILAKYPDLGY
jgi:hypothetical protein